MANLSTEVIIAICLGCILVLIIAAFIFTAVFFRNKLKMFLRRNNLNNTYKPSLEDPDQSVSTFETNSTELSRYAFIKSCAKKHEDRNILFHEEFKNLPDYTLTKSTSVSRAKVNKFKNRYSNIEAFNHSRVILNDGTHSGDDYINANFVQGFSCAKKFIATQGPKAETVNDFWRMIYLHKVKAIVMLTNLMENGVIKCHQYWPSVLNKTVSYGSNKVTMVEEGVCGDYVKRKFDLVTSNSSKGDKKASFSTITHYYYQKWYDRGVPDTYPISILKLIRDVNETIPPQDYPIVVHCSAGVGRTGTYITLDAMLENLNTSESFIDIPEFVSKIRAQRSYLVQTLPQYIFIHDSLNDYCLFGFTDIKAGQLSNTYRNLKQKFNGNRENIKEIEQLMVEYNKLNIQKSLITETTVALENSEQNRDENILCYDENRCQLSGDQKSSYINASLILESFIITQDPLPSTIHQFWKMVQEYNAKIIVSLNKEFSVEYEDVNWPTPENPCCVTEFNNYQYEIKLLDNEPPKSVELPNNLEKSFTVQYLKILDLTNKKESYVTNLVLTETWKEDTPMASPSTAHQLINRLVCLIDMNKESSVLIHGGGGGSNCLLVCAMYVLADQLQYETSVDVFNVVKFLHTQRFNAKINYEQYDFLYRYLTELEAAIIKKF